MKDKLRELAVSLGKECGESDKGSRIRVSTVRFFLKKMLAILDAEGDGGAVGEEVVAGALFDFMGYLTTRDEAITLSGSHEASSAVTAIQDFAKKRDLNLDDADVKNWRALIYTHPARSGVVRDEDVLASQGAAEKWASENGFVAYMAPTGYMRAALEHFAKRIDEDMRDAERYRHVCENLMTDRNGMFELQQRVALDTTECYMSKDSADEAIDAAIKGERHER